MAEKIQARIEPAQPQAEKDARAPQAEADASAASGTAAATEENAAAEPTGGATPEPGAFARASRWLNQTFPNSKHAVLGGACGLLVAILLFSIGLFKTLVIAILVVAGVALGQFADGDPKLVRIVEKLIKKH